MLAVVKCMLSLCFTWQSVLFDWLSFLLAVCLAGWLWSLAYATGEREKGRERGGAKGVKGLGPLFSPLSPTVSRPDKA